VRPKDEDEFRDFVTARWHALVRMAYLLTGDHGRAEAALSAAIRDTRGPAVDREYLRNQVSGIVNGNGLTFDGVTIRVPWSGRIAGQQALLITVQPHGGASSPTPSTAT